MKTENKAEKETGPGNASGILNRLDKLADAMIKTGNAGRAYSLTHKENELLCRAQTNRAAGNALTSAEWQALDAYLNHGKRNRNFLEISRACFLADEKEKQLKAQLRARRNRADKIESAILFVLAGLGFAGIGTLLVALFVSF